MVKDTNCNFDREILFSISWSLPFLFKIYIHSFIMNLRGIELMLRKRHFVTFKKNKSLISDDYDNAFNMSDINI